MEAANWKGGAQTVLSSQMSVAYLRLRGRGTCDSVCKPERHSQLLAGVFSPLTYGRNLKRKLLCGTGCFRPQASREGLSAGVTQEKLRNENQLCAGKSEPVVAPRTYLSWSFRGRKSEECRGQVVAGY